MNVPGSTPDPNPGEPKDAFCIEEQEVTLTFKSDEGFAPGDEIFWVPEGQTCDAGSAVAPLGGALDASNQVVVTFSDVGNYEICVKHASDTDFELVDFLMVVYP